MFLKKVKKMKSLGEITCLLLSLISEVARVNNKKTIGN